jgi:sirohydrochlorin ferrochelatase
MKKPLPTISLVLLLLANQLVFAQQAQGQPQKAQEKVGVLVMAHGGSEDWNAAVEDAIAAIRDACPAVIAFGMAERASLEEGVVRLEGAGANRIVVVRLFISGASFLHQTEYLLGIRPDPPAQFARHHSESTHHHESSHENQVPASIQTTSEFVLSAPGLADSPHMGEILRERVKALRQNPETESVLILAHGAGDDQENDEIIARIASLAQSIGQLGPFRAINAETLREDWPEKRKLAEERIRGFVTEGNQNGGRVIVVPFRLFGFGPYHEVLEGLSYVSDGNGLLPHPIITAWIKEQVEASCNRAGWKNPFAVGSAMK